MTTRGFEGMVTDDGKIVLDFPKQFRAWLVAKFKGREFVLYAEDKLQAKTRRQEMGLHAMIQVWSRDEGHRIEDLKHALLREVFGEIEVPDPLTGEVRMALRKPHTSKLTKQEYSELIERTLEIAAGCGVILQAPDEYRRNHPEKYPETRKRRSGVNGGRPDHGMDCARVLR